MTGGFAWTTGDIGYQLISTNHSWDDLGMLGCWDAASQAQHGLSAAPRIGVLDSGEQALPEYISKALYPFLCMAVNLQSCVVIDAIC